MSIDIKGMIPRQGFIPDYVKWARTQTDAPAIFHVAGALAVASAELSNRTNIVMRGRADNVAYPVHLWLMLIGSSRTRKSTCVQLAEQTVKAKSKLLLPPVRRKTVTEGRMVPMGPPPVVTGLGRSPEAFFDVLSQFTNLLVLGRCEELRKVSWRGSGVSLLCEMFDRGQLRYACTIHRRRDPRAQPNGTVSLVAENPHMTWMMDAHPVDITRPFWRGGLLDRVLMVYGESYEDVRPFPRRTVVPPALLARLNDRAVRQLQMHKDAVPLWSDLARGTRGSVVHVELPRLPMQVLRVAGLYAATQGKLEIDVDTMQRAIAFGEYCRLSRSYVLAGLELGVLG